MFSVIILYFHGFLNKKHTLCIQNGVFRQKFEKCLEIWLFSDIPEN